MNTKLRIMIDDPPLRLDRETLEWCAKLCELRDTAHRRADILRYSGEAAEAGWLSHFFRSLSQKR